MRVASEVKNEWVSLTSQSTNRRHFGDDSVHFPERVEDWIDMQPWLTGSSLMPKYCWSITRPNTIITSSYECCRYYRSTWNDVQGVELCVSQLKVHGSVWWLNVSDHISRTRRLTHAHLLTKLFVFKSCVVIVANEVSKDKKKNKVTRCLGNFYFHSSTESKHNVYSAFTSADTQLMSVEYLCILYRIDSSRKSGEGDKRPYHFTPAGFQHCSIFLQETHPDRRKKIHLVC